AARLLGKTSNRREEWPPCFLRATQEALSNPGCVLLFIPAVASASCAPVGWLVLILLCGHRIDPSGTATPVGSVLGLGLSNLTNEPCGCTAWVGLLRCASASPRSRKSRPCWSPLYSGIREERRPCRMW